MVSWRLARFDELSAREVHDLYRLRVAVFIVEQNCVFQDIDGVDPECWHLMGFSPSALGEGRGGGPTLIAYCRLCPPGTKFAEPSIGRVITTGSVRRSGLGRELMREALAHAERLWPGKDLRIGAQRYLERFYADFGFVATGQPYDEDGIPHVEMVRRVSGKVDSRQ